MKKTALVLALCALALMIVLPATTSVNNSTGSSTGIDRIQQADGWPLPPPIPPKPPVAALNTLMADGWPLPPPIPPKPPVAALNTLMADGWPLPPPIPPKPPVAALNTLMADGWPLPPPIPPNSNALADASAV